MSNRHLKALEESLGAKGWRVVAAIPGNDYDGSGTWEIQRSTGEPCVLIDFEGLDDMTCLPLQESYGCHVRGIRTISLYFRRVNRSQQLWDRELADFLQQLDSVGDA
jgi:hypothetical protein